MRDPPQWMKGLKRISVGTVLKSVASVGEQAPILLQEARTRQKSKVSTMVPSSPVTVSSTRHRHSRTAFTAEDRYHLARWLAYMCPEPAGRLAINLYRRLVVCGHCVNSDTRPTLPTTQCTGGRRDTLPTHGRSTINAIVTRTGKMGRFSTE